MICRLLFLALSMAIFTSCNLLTCKQGDEWAGDGLRYVELIDRGRVMKLDDHSVEKALEIRSTHAVPVDTTLSYELKFMWLGQEVPPSGASAAVIALDNEGRALKEFTTTMLYGWEWRDDSVQITAQSWPEGTAAVRFRFLAASAPAETGVAYFREIEFAPLEKTTAVLPDVSGREISGKCYFKHSGIVFENRTFKHGPYAFQQQVPTLEVSWARDTYPDSLQLLTDRKELGKVLAAAWNEEMQSFDAPVEATMNSTGDTFVVDLTALPQTRKVMVSFPQAKSFEIYKAAMREVAYPNGTGLASCIWFSQLRYDYVNASFRHEFHLDRKPKEAYLQEWHSGDFQTFTLNGKSIQGHDVTDLLQAGRNLIVSKQIQGRYVYGLTVEIDLVYDDGSKGKIVTGSDWKVYEGDAPEGWDAIDYDDSAWQNAVVIENCFRGYVGRIPSTIMTAENCSLPKELQAGKEYSLQWQFSQQTSGLNPSAPATAVLMRNGVQFGSWSLGIVDGGLKSQTLTLAFRPSPFLVEGDYHLLIRAQGFEFNGYESLIHIRNDRKPLPAKACLKEHNGVQTIFVDGVPLPCLSSSSTSHIAQSTRRFSRQGIHLFTAIVGIGVNEDGTADCTNVDAVMQEVLAGDPDAKVILRSYLGGNPPEWFRKKFPGDIVRFDNGGTNGTISLASENWRDVRGRSISDAIRHVRNSPYADKVIGYFLGDGEEAQWMHPWGGPDPRQNGDVLADYSEAMLKAFRKWLSAKYVNDDALQKAWNEGGVTLATASIPTREERIEGIGAFRDPSRSRKAMDFGEALADVVQDGIIHYARIVKETSENQSLYATLYGHIIDLGCCWLGENVGYFKQQRVIESPYVDILCGPHYYFEPFRNVGGVGSQDFPSPMSLYLHGKLWWNEDDARTHLRTPHEYEYTMDCPEKCRQNLARHFAMALCGTAGSYLFDLTGERNWYDDPEFLPIFRQLAQIDNDALTHDRSSAAEIALVFDELSGINYRQVSSWSVSTDDMIMQYMIFNREQLARAGAPYDLCRLADICNPRLKPYKLYVFANTCRISKAQRRQIKAMLAKNNASALWLHAPGVFEDENNLDVANAEELTGCALKLDTTPRNTLLEYVDGSVWGYEGIYSPALVPQKYDDLLARFQQDGAPALVRSGRNFFAATPCLSREVYQKIAEAAGVEILSRDGDAVYRCHDYLAVHTSMRKGFRTIRIPSGRKLKRLFPAEPLPEESISDTEYRFRSDSPTTLIFLLLK